MLPPKQNFPPLPFFFSTFALSLSFYLFYFQKKSLDNLSPWWRPTGAEKRKSKKLQKKKKKKSHKGPCVMGFTYSICTSLVATNGVPLTGEGGLIRDEAIIHISRNMAAKNGNPWRHVTAGLTEVYRWGHTWDPLPDGVCESESTKKKSDDKGSDGRASSAAKTGLAAPQRVRSGHLVPGGLSTCSEKRKTQKNDKKKKKTDRLLHVVQWRRQCGGKRSRGPPHSKYEDQKHATPADTTLLCAAEVIPQAGRWASTKIAAHTALGLRVK